VPMLPPAPVISTVLLMGTSSPFVEQPIPRVPRRRVPETGYLAPACGVVECDDGSAGTEFSRPAVRSVICRPD
jgi:hypothetical protein